MDATRRGRPRSATIDEAVLAAARRRSPMTATRPVVRGGRRGGRHVAPRDLPPLRHEGRARGVGDGLVPGRRGAAGARAMTRSPTSSPSSPTSAAASACRARLSLVGTMLQRRPTPDAAERYRARVIAPPRAPARDPRARGRRRADRRDTDLDVAVTMLTGSWYARCLAGDPEPATGRAGSQRWPGARSAAAPPS